MLLSAIFLLFSGVVDHTNYSNNLSKNKNSGPHISGVYMNTDKFCKKGAQYTILCLFFLFFSR